MKKLEVVDIQQVSLSDPLKALKTFELKKKPAYVNCDILIAGGGIGGVAAALRAAKLDVKICLTEETNWLGGQMTSQGVSVLDENHLVETSGATLKYQELRTAIRGHYQAFAQGRSPAANSYLNPGNCWVSRLSFEPKVALTKILDLLEPSLKAGNLKVFYRVKLVSVKVIHNKIKSLLAVNLDSGSFIEFRPKICLDATELGDVIALSGFPYATGTESCSETKEPHAPLSGNPEKVQDYVYPFVIDFRPNEKNVVDKPANYEYFKAQGKFSLGNYKMFATTNTQLPDGKEVVYLPFWEYRRLIASQNFPASHFQYDLAMINWESNDLQNENIIDKSPDVIAHKLALAKNLSLSFFYWLLTEAPRDEGGYGYPELFYRTDVFETADGLAKHPYIRESRRLKSEYTIVEHDIADDTTSDVRARHFFDSIGIGFYPIDLHEPKDTSVIFPKTRPFQIPLRSLVSIKAKNLIPACKNIGTTHITNGAYRLHPIEWAIGEAAGVLAAFSLQARTNPFKITKNRRLLRKLQNELVKSGAPIYWYDDVPTTHPAFAEIQFASIAGLIMGSAEDLHFRPDDLVTRAEAALSLSALLRLPNANYSSPPPDVQPSRISYPAIERCLQTGVLALKADNKFYPDEPLTAADLQELPPRFNLKTKTDNFTEGKFFTRANFAVWLYQQSLSKQHLGRT